MRGNGKRTCVLCLLFTVGAPLLLYVVSRSVVPSWVIFREKNVTLAGVTFVADDFFMRHAGRGLPDDAPDAPDELRVERERCYLQKRGETLYLSPSEWRVQDAFFDDIDHDGAGEVIILCWKRGSFGRYRPSYVRRDTDFMTQHIYLFDYDDGTLRELWMSSALDVPVAAAINDGNGRLLCTSPDGAVSAWHWVTWGLERDFS